MIKLLNTIFALLLISSILAVQAQPKLTVEISNLRNDEGSVAIELIDKNNNTVEAVKTKIVNKKSFITFNNLKYDKYAVRVFHDENSNDKIDKNFIGIPKEGFALSNDEMGKFGPKAFEDWLFEVADDTKISLIIKYF